MVSKDVFSDAWKLVLEWPKDLEIHDTPEDVGKEAKNATEYG